MLQYLFSGRGALEVEQHGEPERGDADDGHEPDQDGHHRLQSAHSETGSVFQIYYFTIFQTKNSFIGLAPEYKFDFQTFINAEMVRPN